MMVLIEILNKRDHQVGAHACTHWAFGDLGLTAPEISRNENTTSQSKIWLRNT